MAKNTVESPPHVHEADGNYTKCVKCGSYIQPWIMRNKVLTGIITLMVIALLASIVNNYPTNVPIIPMPEAITEPEPTPPPVPEVNKANCDLIKSGMTREEVKAIIGEPGLTSESEIAGYGKSEYWNYTKRSSSQSCSVTFIDGLVSSKTWINM